VTYQGTKILASGEIDVTIVVVAWNVAPFIAQAVRSCLEQSAAGVETIIIDNCSTDGTLQVIERETAGYANVRIVRNSTNLGLGPARNQGVEMARGSYIAFLDGDDWFEPSAVELAQRAAREQDADVVVFDHSRHYPNGRIQHGLNRRMLRERLCRRLEDRFEVARSFNSAWNKLYRRSFLQAEGFRFAATYYEDIDWTFPILMVAPVVVALPKPLINYRLRGGSILRSPSPRHIEVFERWRSVLDFMRRHSQHVDGGWHREISLHIVRHVEAILRSPHRGSLAQRFRISAEATQLYRAMDPGCALQLRGARRLRYKLIWRGWSRTALFMTLLTTVLKR